VRLAVLIPAFNATADLQRTLTSLASDSFPFDIVVVDDGSRPRLQLPETSGDHRILLLRHDRNRGVAHALNTGIAHVLDRGYEYVARLDAGDMNELRRLVTQVEYLDHHRDVAIVGAWTRHLDEQLQPLYTTRYPTTWDAILRCFRYRTAFSHPTCVIRTEVLRRSGGYDERFALGEDYELFWRVARRYPCANIPEVLVVRIESRGSLTRCQRRSAARTRLRLQWQHFNWARADCWFGLARSLGLLMIPAPMAMTVKRALGTIRVMLA
jgi:GT2 family glycosyltransferase